jgi:AAA family ATP:ADP antiporter
MAASMHRRFTRTERFFSLFTTLRAGEGLAARHLCLQAFAIMFAYYLLKVIREPMILADGSAELKAYSTALQALLLMFIVPLFAAMYRRFRDSAGKHHLFRNTLLFFVANLLLFALAQAAGLRVGIVFYIWLGIFSVMILALFWAFAADLFNLKSGQRIFPLIAAAAALGALLGSGLAGDLDSLLGHSGVMVVAAGLLMLPCLGAAGTDRLVPPGSRCSGEGTGPRGRSYPLLQGFEIVWRSPTLRLIAVLVVLLNLINTNGEYILASFVIGHTQAMDARAADSYITGFYSSYLFATTGLSFLVQLFLVSRIFKRIGIAGALWVLPVLMIINYSLIALFPLLMVVRLAMMLENSVNYSLGTTTRHALFLPVPREEKYVGKHTVDTFFFRVGDVLSGSFVFAASSLAGLQIAGFVLLNAVFAALMLLVSVAIGRRHRGNARRAMANQPPIAAGELEDLTIPAGQATQLHIAADTFIDPDVGDALRYLALPASGDRLPPWVKFDGLNRRFEFHPPADCNGSLRIRLVARDFDGLEAEVSFTVIYGG